MDRLREGESGVRDRPCPLPCRSPRGRGGGVMLRLLDLRRKGGMKDAMMN